MLEEVDRKPGGARCFLQLIDFFVFRHWSLPRTFSQCSHRKRNLAQEASVLIRVSIVASAVCLAASSADALCLRSSIGIDWEDHVVNELKYLICLHNEQNDALNSQGDIINSHADDINSIYRLLEAMASGMDSYETRINDLEERIAELEAGQ